MSNNTLLLSISKGQISEMPAVEYHGRIVVVDNERTAAKAVAYLNDQKIVGFDTETKPSFRKGRTNKVALMQIASEDICFLFRINHLGLFDDLKQFLENENIVKIGLSVKDDFHVLRRIAEVEPQSFIELQSYVKNYCIADASLQKIYGIVFGERISKGQRLSNWEAEELSEAQKQYAAIDAWSCLKLYKYMEAGEFDPSKSPYVKPEETIQE